MVKLDDGGNGMIGEFIDVQLAGACGKEGIFQPEFNNIGRVGWGCESISSVDGVMNRLQEIYKHDLN